MVFEFMSNPVTMTGWTLLAYIGGWIAFIILGIFLLWLINTTPVMVFKKASWLRRPVLNIDFRDGGSVFRVGNQEVPGSATVKGIGTFQLVEGSGVRERRSGVALYHVFAEAATTVPKSYPAVLDELRNLGVPITKFEDYKNFLTVLNSVEEQNKLKKNVSPKNWQAFEVILNRIKTESLQVKPFRSYKMHELTTMFPFNLNPSYIEAYAQAKLNAYIKKHKANMDLIIYGAVGVLILIIACVVAYKFLKSDPQTAVSVVCQFPDAAMNVTKQMINGTLQV